MKTGLTANTKGRLVFGPGQLYKNFDEDLLTGTELGATRGDSEFNRGLTLRAIAVDGLLSPVEVLRRREKVEPTLRCSLLEITADNLQLALAGSTTNVDDEIVGGEVDAATADNIALVAENADGEDFIIMLYHPIATDISPMSTPDKGEMILSVTFTGHMATDDLETEPWKIIPLTEAS